MIVASESPGQRGMLMQRNSSGSAPVHRYWNAVPTGMSIESLVPERLSLPCAVSAPDPPSPERTCQNSLTVAWTVATVHLTWRDRGVDHAADLAIHQVPDLCPCGADVGAAGTRVCMENLRLLEALSRADTWEPLRIRDAHDIPRHVDDRTARGRAGRIERHAGQISCAGPRRCHLARRLWRCQHDPEPHAAGRHGRARQQPDDPTPRPRRSRSPARAASRA